MGFGKLREDLVVEVRILPVHRLELFIYTPESQGSDLYDSVVNGLSEYVRLRGKHTLLAGSFLFRYSGQCSSSMEAFRQLIHTRLLAQRLAHKFKLTVIENSLRKGSTFWKLRAERPDVLALEMDAAVQEQRQAVHELAAIVRDTRKYYRRR